MPPEITIRIPSSTDIGMGMVSLRGTKRRKPLVGLGVVGTNTSRMSEVFGLSWGQRADLVTNANAKMFSDQGLSWLEIGGRMRNFSAPAWMRLGLENEVDDRD